MFYISTANRLDDRGRYDRNPGAAPSIYDPAGRFQRTQSIMGKQENEHKKENDGKNTQQIQTYYRVFDNSKSTIDLTIALEYEWSKIMEK